MLRALLFLPLLLLAAAAPSQKVFRPTPEEVVAAYKQGEQLERARQLAYKLNLTPRWIEGGKAFWYRNALGPRKEEFWLVECETGANSRPFDAKRLAEMLSKSLGETVTAENLPFDEFEFADGRSAIRFGAGGKRWRVNLSDYSITEDTQRTAGGGNPAGQGGQGGANRSPDGAWVTQISEGKLKVRKAGEENPVYESPIEGVASARWSPDSKQLVVMKLIPGDRKPIYLIRSTPTIGTRGELITRFYDQPGDRLDTYETFIVDPFMKSEIKTDLPPIWTGGHPWTGPPGIQWMPGGKEFQIDYAERGYGRFFVEAVSLETGKRRSIIDEDPPTFFDTTAQQLRLLRKTPEVIWRSERDGFGRLYLIDTQTGLVKNPITPAGWVVRSIHSYDEDARRLIFSANNVDAGQDPYLQHFFSVGFDGNGLVRLTDGPGSHRLTFSPNSSYFVDTWSRVDAPPVHELRRTSDGKKVAELERADLSEWKSLKLSMPEVFVAKGRDGKTDIWGIVHRPSNFDPKKKYPVIESIYAGPHDSHVPKTFSPYYNLQKLAEFGFIVVQIDGMGTRNRGKAFHDVAYKNIADAGFPDRILWMQALAKKYRYVDIERVGVYGTSAGGQSSTGALLFHPDFYKVAVSSCGCHDNRMDKTWWNEQWMGPFGPHYVEQSNITHAGKLKGKLMLMVGELDRNVPPESTFRLADALIKANKEFELVLLPGLDHTGGGPYGDRKRTDFFIRHLLGAEAPNWNDLP